MASRPEPHDRTRSAVFRYLKSSRLRSPTSRPRESRTTAVIGTTATPARNFGTPCGCCADAEGLTRQTAAIKIDSLQRVAGPRQFMVVSERHTASAVVLPIARPTQGADTPMHSHDKSSGRGRQLARQEARHVPAPHAVRRTGSLVPSMQNAGATSARAQQNAQTRSSHQLKIGMSLSSTSTARPLQRTESGASGALGDLSRSLIPTVRFPAAQQFARAPGATHLTLDAAIAEALENNLELLPRAPASRSPTRTLITAQLRPNPVLSLGGDHLDFLGTGFNDVNGAGPSRVQRRASTFCSSAAQARSTSGGRAGRTRDRRGGTAGCRCAS